MSTPYKVHITAPQLIKLLRCGNKKKPCKIKLHLKAAANRVLKLNPTQIASIENARRLGKAIYTLVLSGSQTGGILPFLIPALAAIGKAAGLGMAGYVGSKVAQKIVGKGKGKVVGKGLFLPGTKKGWGVFLPGKRG